jgi:hypothetical protein
MKEAYLGSQNIMTKIQLLLRNIISEDFIVNLTTSFHILTQRWGIHPSRLYRIVEAFL